MLLYFIRNCIYQCAALKLFMFYSPKSKPFSTEFEEEKTQITQNSSFEKEHLKSYTKFFRKPDFKIDRKKKTDNETSIMCFLTPKNCGSKNKLLKEQISQYQSQLDLSSLLSATSSATEPESQSQKIIRKGPSFETSGLRSGQHKQFVKQNNNFVSVVQSNEVLNDEFNKCKGAVIQNQDSEKAYRKLEKQIQSYRQKAQEFKRNSQIQKHKVHQLQKQNSELTKQIKRLKIQLVTDEQKRKQEVEKLTREIESLKAEQLEHKNEAQIQAKRLEQKVIHFQVQCGVLENSLSQATEKVAQFEQTSRKQKQFQNSNKRNKSFTGSCSLSGKAEQSQAESNQHLNTIASLTEQLKYCQIQIEMLKRVKFDASKHTAELSKLQRQNKILKAQLFKVKTEELKEKALKQCGHSEQTKRSDNTQNLSNSRSTEIKAKLKRCTNGQRDRGNRFSRLNEQSSCNSNDTISLNLSLSPEKYGRS